MLAKGAVMAQFTFDPDQVAFYETEGWRAYYERRWPQLLRLTVDLCHSQFHIPFPKSWLAAYYVTRASVAWVPLDHDIWMVRTYLERFYRVARQSSGLRFDPERVGALELRYFDVHRRLAESPDKREFVDIMTELHSALFGITSAEARESAEARVLAATLVDRITSHRSTDVGGDWVRIEEALRVCYGSIARHLHKEAAAA